jgi:hypothetical protein
MPGNGLPRKILERKPQETRSEGRYKERLMDEVRWSTTSQGWQKRILDTTTREKKLWVKINTYTVDHSLYQ